MTSDNLDKATEELLINNARLWSRYLGGNDKLVQELIRGDETFWDSVRTLALHGEITRKTAFYALRKCLEKKIPEYLRNSEVEISPGYYWSGRAKEALKARKGLESNNSIIDYRGIPLAKEVKLV